MKFIYFTVTLIGVFFAISISLFGEFIVILLYGTDFIETFNILRILIISTVFSAINGSKLIWIISTNSKKEEIYITLTGLFVNFSLNIFLIPIYGLIAAALINLTTEIFISLIAPLFFKKTRSIPLQILSSFWIIPKYIKDNFFNL
jgi:O-antigen/teichoic acid export membrane protein